MLTKSFCIKRPRTFCQTSQHRRSRGPAAVVSLRRRRPVFGLLRYWMRRFCVRGRRSRHFLPSRNATICTSASIELSRRSIAIGGCSMMSIRRAYGFQRDRHGGSRPAITPASTHLARSKRIGVDSRCVPRWCSPNILVHRWSRSTGPIGKAPSIGTERQRRGRHVTPRDGTTKFTHTGTFPRGCVGVVCYR